jgi:hypothetical protein
MVYFLTRLDCQSNAKPSEKDHDLPGIRTRDLWISSQHTQPLHNARSSGNDSIPVILKLKLNFTGGHATHLEKKYNNNNTYNAHHRIE